MNLNETKFAPSEVRIETCQKTFLHFLRMTLKQFISVIKTIIKQICPWK